MSVYPSKELAFSPPEYVPAPSSVTNFRNPQSAQKTFNDFAAAYTQQLASGEGLIPADTHVNAFVETDLPRPTLFLRAGSQLPIASKIREKFGNIFDDPKNTGLTCQSAEDGTGAVIVNVKIGSAADDAKLKVSDVIYAAHSYTVADAAELAAVAFKVPGPLEVFFLRPGTTTKLQAVLYRR